MSDASFVMRRPLAARLALLGAAFCLSGEPVSAQIMVEPRSATIFSYSRFGDDELPSSSIRVDQFEAHLRELTSGGYTVLPLSEIAEALRSERPLPDRAVGIAIDDTHRSVYREAWPRLQAAGLPFTLFIATDTVDRARTTHMTWDQVRELAAGGVEIGNQTASFAHLMDQEPAFVVGQIERASERIQAVLGRKPRLFAYPYGEYGNALRETVIGGGFLAAFGLHSGVAHPSSDRFALPRFTLNEQLGSIERFRLAAHLQQILWSVISTCLPVLPLAMAALRSSGSVIGVSRSGSKKHFHRDAPASIARCLPAMAAGAGWELSSISPDPGSADPSAGPEAAPSAPCPSHYAAVHRRNGRRAAI
jgi:poly-beta-1,6-N-acetyl-D-glucosamine N-deacetylase